MFDERIQSKVQFSLRARFYRSTKLKREEKKKNKEKYRRFRRFVCALLSTYIDPSKNLKSINSHDVCEKHVANVMRPVSIYP